MTAAQRDLAIVDADLESPMVLSPLFATEMRVVLIETDAGPPLVHAELFEDYQRGTA